MGLTSPSFAAEPLLNLNRNLNLNRPGAEPRTHCGIKIKITIKIKKKRLRLLENHWRTLRHHRDPILHSVRAGAGHEALRGLVERLVRKPESPVVHRHH